MPKHLSEHWSGYNIRKPLRAPTPLGAVVPQCFGYYVPEAEEARGQYLSPILLVEDGGDQVTDKRLDASEDERQECADMYLRLHEAGWVHGSVAYRNTVVQKGPLYLPPEERTMDEPSFRIIDFGRAVKDEKEGHELRWLENEDVLKCFHCGNWSKKQRV
ncbi:hypothetical protein K523DRAFT_335844 [Schizophyllum commune Tattone D]|nr:hypothetical protein K523DRAFT_335844 [Schizophyllum commune Tattone D]